MTKNNIVLKNEKLYVGLGSTVDFSRWESFSRNERIDETLKPSGLVYFEVSTLRDASELTQKFIKEFRLGSSNWLGGLVIDYNLKFIAKVSYNGRVWDNKDWKDAKEIEIC